MKCQQTITVRTSNTQKITTVDVLLLVLGKIEGAGLGFSCAISN
jgi:hypothetical protein